jgi:hypothetical protein
MSVVAQRGGEDASSSSDSSFWSNRSYAMEYLSPLLTCHPSKETIIQITSIPLPPPLSSSSPSGLNVVDVEISFIFLKVAARHFPTLLSENVSKSLDYNAVREQIHLLVQVNSMFSTC